MEILGYSERGMVSSLFYEIAYSDKSKELISDLIREIGLVGDESGIPLIEGISDCQIIIEQSFSDFGDPDALLLITLNANSQNKSERTAIFFEAKVKPFYRQSWSIHREWEELHKRIDKKQPASSNLFMQIYHKQRMVNAMKDKQHKKEDIHKGVKFDEWSTKRERKIGKNGVVLKANEQLGDFIDQVYYIAIVPDSVENMETFLGNPTPVYGQFKWDMVKEGFGYITWKQIHEFSKSKNLNRTLKAFKHNEGQIYRNARECK